MCVHTGTHDLCMHVCGTMSVYIRNSSLSTLHLPLPSVSNVMDAPLATLITLISNAVACPIAYAPLPPPIYCDVCGLYVVCGLCVWLCMVYVYSVGVVFVVVV